MYVAGAAVEVAGEAGAWTVAKPEITEDTCVSIVKAQAIATVGKKWYENPAIVGKMPLAYGDDYAGGYNANFDAEKNWFIGANGFTGRPGQVGTLADLIAGGNPIYTYNTTAQGADIVRTRGTAISTAYGVVLHGSAGSEGAVMDPSVRAYALNDKTLLASINLKCGETVISPGAFSIVGNTLYANDYIAGTKGKLYKCTIPAAGFVDGATWQVTEIAVTEEGGEAGKIACKYGFRTWKIDETVYIVVKGDSESEVWFGTDGGAFVKKTGFSGSRYSDYCVAGDHFYVFNYTQNGSRTVDVYELDKTTGWATGDKLYSFNAKSSGLHLTGDSSGLSLFVTDNEETLLVVSSIGSLAVQYTPYTVTVADGIQNGTVTVDPVKADAGTTVTVTATPDAGYKLVSITTNGQVLAGNSFEMPAENVTVAATFELITYDITIAEVQNGTLETSVTNKIAAGTTVTVIATPASGYELESITTNGTAITGTTFEMPAENVTVAATFKSVSTDPIDDPTDLDDKGEANLEALKEALPPGANINEWAATVYADGKIPAAKLNASTPALIAAAAKYDLAVMADPVEVKVEATETANCFKFTLSDADKANPLVAATKIQMLVQYTTALGEATPFTQSNDKAVAVAPDSDTAPTCFTATFTGNDKTGAAATAGFMKVEVK